MLKFAIGLFGVLLVAVLVGTLIAGIRVYVARARNTTATRVYGWFSWSWSIFGRALAIMAVVLCGYSVYRFYVWCSESRVTIPPRGKSGLIRVPPYHHMEIVNGDHYRLHNIYTDGRDCTESCTDGPLSGMVVENISSGTNVITYAFAPMK